MNIKHEDEDEFKRLYKILSHLHLQIAVVFWLPMPHIYFS